jgi:hypothetical protein
MANILTVVSHNVPIRSVGGEYKETNATELTDFSLPGPSTPLPHPTALVCNPLCSPPRQTRASRSPTSRRVKQRPSLATTRPPFSLSRSTRRNLVCSLLDRWTGRESGRLPQERAVLTRFFSGVSEPNFSTSSPAKSFKHSLTRNLFVSSSQLLYPLFSDGLFRLARSSKRSSLPPESGSQPPPTTEPSSSTRSFPSRLAFPRTSTTLTSWTRIRSGRTSKIAGSLGRLLRRRATRKDSCSAQRREREGRKPGWRSRRGAFLRLTHRSD